MQDDSCRRSWKKLFAKTDIINSSMLLFEILLWLLTIHSSLDSEFFAYRVFRSDWIHLHSRTF